MVLLNFDHSYFLEKAADGDDGFFNKNSEKPIAVSAQARQRLKQLLETENELYDYLKQRLNRQHAKLLRNQLPLLESIKKRV